MANKRTQSTRLAAEAAHTPTHYKEGGRAVEVVEHYRLQPDDLPGGQWEGQIHSVNTLGVEALTPLIFIEGLTKPLALSDDDVQTLMRMTDSPFAGEWVGRKVMLRAVRIDGVRMLRLYAPGAAGLPVDVPSPPHPKRKQRSWLTLSLLFALIALSVWLVYAVEQRTLIWTLLQQAIATPGVTPTP